jgi:hypothetical protein
MLLDATSQERRIESLTPKNQRSSTACRGRDGTQEGTFGHCDEVRRSATVRFVWSFVHFLVHLSPRLCVGFLDASFTDL